MPDPTSRLLRIFSNPWVGLITSLCTVLSVPLAVLLYWKSIKERDLTYFVHPIRTVVLQSDYASGLRVLHNDEELKASVTAVQIVMWNRGKEAIFRKDILKPVRIIASPPVRVLEAQIQKQTRDIVEMSFESTLLKEGIIPISWNLLEDSDGAVIQILYAGTPEIEFKLEGLILGQKGISRLVSPPVFEEKPRVSGASPVLALGIASIIAGFFLVVLSLSFRRDPGFKWSSLFMAAGGILLIVLAFFAFRAWIDFPEPPFGF